VPNVKEILQLQIVENKVFVNIGLNLFRNFCIVDNGNSKETELLASSYKINIFGAKVKALELNKSV
jgi:hypothetical protein